MTLTVQQVQEWGLHKEMARVINAVNEKMDATDSADIPALIETILSAIHTCE